MALEASCSAGSPLRVALLAGTLERGGAEKQLYLQARCLQEAGAIVRVFSLVDGGFYKQMLRDLEIEVEVIPRGITPFLRASFTARRIGRFRPGIVHCGHFFVNVYGSLAARLCRAVEFGTARSDIEFEYDSSRLWARWCLRWPRNLIVNSHLAKQRATTLGVHPSSLYILPNVIDIQAFDREAAQHAHLPSSGRGRCVVIAVGNLLPVKRLDRFIRAIALAQRDAPNLMTYIVGDGPERSQLQRLAAEAGVLGTHLEFLGDRDDIPAIMAASDFFALTSEHEGLPNVILEAMAARLPVVTTPAGDAPFVVEDQVTGFVVPHDDADELGRRMVLLASSPEMRTNMGAAGRRKVEEGFSRQEMLGRLLDIYLAGARSVRRDELAATISRAMDRNQLPTGPTTRP